MIDYLSLEDLLEIVDIANLQAVRDIGLLDSAAHRPQTSLFGDDAYLTLHEKAAVLLESVVRNQALIDGNRRFGVVGDHGVLSPQRRGVSCRSRRGRRARHRCGDRHHELPGLGCQTGSMDIDVDLIRRDLAQLVNFPSTGGSDAEIAAQRWCAATLTGLGMDVDQWRLDLDGLRADADYPGEEVERDEAWGVVGTSGPGIPALILNGHVDVVPPGDADSWTSGDPWHVREQDDHWFGRGVCDMKGGVVAIIAAARAVSDLPLNRPFAVHSVIGEEDGGIGAFATLRRGHTGDVCLIAEPTAGQIVSANAGSLTFRLEVHGQSTHGSMRSRGHSAIQAFERVHRALGVLEAERNTAPPAPFTDVPWPISVGIVHAGDWASTVPDLLVAEGRYGVMPGETFTAAKRVFETAVADAAAGDPWLAEHPPIVTWPGGHFAAGQLAFGHPFGDEVRHAAIAAGAEAPDLIGAPYGSDLRQYAAAGIPTVQYGPGDIVDAHAVDEQVSIDDIVTCARTYAELIIARCT
ncbi:ArgE/DapE family deacylase [Aeromicrobium sp. UC242_57]|uniref:ArgE/DapE family deacylase n=1 Tax=Aeromicrobium sp. UC242_57 TaxID=3374624 RepID=UPI0037AD8581